MFTKTAKQATAFKAIKYLEGLPREYRFNAKEGTVTDSSGNALTKKGEAFSFIPLAYRMFPAEMYNRERKMWAEFFFLNDKGHVSLLMFHGYSVESFQKSLSELFYEDATPLQSVITVTPEPKANEHGTYYVASFAMAPMPDADAAQIEAIRNGIDPLFQYQTANIGLEESAGLNYGLPTGHDAKELNSGE